MSAALHEFRSRYRAARQRMYQAAIPQPLEVKRLPQPPRVVRSDKVITPAPRWGVILYDAPIGPRMPWTEDQFAQMTTIERAKRIVEEVAWKHGISTIDLVSERRSVPLCNARHEVYYRLRTETTWSLPRIGKFIGNRDHTTVINGIKRHKKRVWLPG